MRDKIVDMRRVKKYLAYTILSTRTRFKTLCTYRIASILNFITQIILLLAQFYFWNAIYDSSTRINTYTFMDMITYLVISYSIGRLYPFNVSNKFGNMVRNGDIIHSFLKPIAFEYQLLTDSFGELLYKLVCISAPIVLTGYLLFGIELSWPLGETIVFLIFFVSSYMFVFVLELFIGVFSFYTYSLWGINKFKTSIINLLSGKLLPLNFYPLVFRNAMYYLPFSTIYFIPVNILIKKEVNNISIFLLIIWCSTLALFVLYKILSAVMIKKIMIQGG